MSVNEMAADEIRALVLAGEIRPGERLAELPLAARLGISRPSVREALRRLESSGLLVADGRQGLRVPVLGDGELRSAILTRAALESLHAGLAARRVRLGEVPPVELRHLASLAQAAGRRGAARRELAERDRAFHRAIDVLADSPVGSQVLTALWDRLLLAGDRAAPPAAAAPAWVAEHLMIVEAIEGGRRRRAREAAERHVRSLLAELGGI